jgi:hypothetical protein
MQRCGKGIVTVILCHQEEKDLECTNRLMAVILGNRLTRNQECLESWENGNRCVSSKFESLVCFDRKYKGGLYRSDDAGEHWELINEDKNLWQRPWYYMNLQTDPKRKWINRM